MSEEKESKSMEGPLGKMLKNKPKPLRQPNCSGEEASVANCEDKSENEPENVELKNVINKFNEDVLTSTLNVNAAEFIPYSQQIQDKTMEGFNIYINNELQCLALYPENYDEILEALYGVLSPFHEDEEVMKFVINIILDECISEQNLHYNGVKLCRDLLKMFGTNFRTYLLESCQDKFFNLTLNQDVSLDRMCSFGLVLAELYLQTDIEEKRIFVLGEALFDFLDILLKNEGEKAIKCVCHILKLTGVSLEENGERSLEKMEDIFSQLRVFISKYEDMDPNLRFTINNVIQMRDSNWSRNTSEESSSMVGAVSANGYGEIVVSGPDGEVITDEEKKFLLENLPSSDEVDVCLGEEESMDDEMFSDYEKFLKLKEEEENKGKKDF